LEIPNGCIRKYDPAPKFFVKEWIKQKGDTVMTIGIVGIGNMGRSIAEHLSEVGETLALWNRTAAKAQGIPNSTVMQTPRNVVEASDIVLSILADDSALEAAYRGPGGILEADLTSKTVIEFCTTSPETVILLEQAVEARGGQFLECPVSGNVVPARSGQLMGLAAGKQAAFDHASPLLSKMTRRLEYLGPTGAGAAMKLAVNLPLMVYWSALGEAIGLALSKGIEPALALDILADSSGAIGAAKKRVPPILNMLINGDPGQVGLSMANGIKDLKLMQDLAGKSGSPSGLVSAALAQAEAAAADGWSDYDCALVGVHAQGGSKA
jgi:3-hydroxyisobutyrate dehydrogenase